MLAAPASTDRLGCAKKTRSFCYMPDTSESNVKKLDPRPEARETGPVPSSPPGGLAQRLAQHRFAIRIGVIGCVLAVAAFVAGREIYHRINYVYSYDSRIEADVITISSRSSGWVTSLLVEEGSTVAMGQTLAAIDARESQLRVAELQAQLAGIDAERDRLVAERRLAEKQTSSLYFSQLSQYETAKVAV